MVRLRDVLALPIVQAGRPLVLTRNADLSRTLRWVHVGEIPDIAGLLRGGELILTTGVALPRETEGLRDYIRTLSDAGACALMIELGRWFEAVPPDVVAAAEALDLPIIVLRRPVRFVAVTETVHSTIVHAQYELLMLSERLHREFTALSIEGAPIPDILSRVKSLGGGPVVLEDLSHTVLAYSSGPGEAGTLLEDWEARSRLAGATASTMAVGPEGWLVTPVGPKRERWGRLVMPLPSAEAQHLASLLERGAEALTLSRLMEKDLRSLVHRAHGDVLTDLLGGLVTDERELLSRTAALGFRQGSGPLIGMAIQVPQTKLLHPVRAEARDRILSQHLADAIKRSGPSAIVATLRHGQALALVAGSCGVNLDKLLTSCATRIDAELQSLDWARGYVIGVGEPVVNFAQATVTLAEAQHTANAAMALRGSKPRPYYRNSDVRLRGLLAQLRDDRRLEEFVDSELRKLRRFDAEHRSDLMSTLREYFEHGGNKSVVAQATNMSRPALYARLSKIEEVLGVALDDAESALALHVAVLAAETHGLLDNPKRRRTT